MRFLRMCYFCRALIRYATSGVVCTAAYAITLVRMLQLFDSVAALHNAPEEFGMPSTRVYSSTVAMLCTLLVGLDFVCVESCCARVQLLAHTCTGCFCQTVKRRACTVSWLVALHRRHMCVRRGIHTTWSCHEYSVWLHGDDVMAHGESLAVFGPAAAARLDDCAAGVFSRLNYELEPCSCSSGHNAFGTPKPRCVDYLRRPLTSGRGSAGVAVAAVGGLPCTVQVHADIP